MTCISEINWGCRNLTPWWIDDKVWWWEAGSEHLTRTFYIEQSIKEHWNTVTHDFHWWGSAEIPRESVIPSQIFPQQSAKKHSSSYQPCDWLTVTVTFDRSIVLWACAIKATLWSWQPWDCTQLQFSPFASSTLFTNIIGELDDKLQWSQLFVWAEEDSVWPTWVRSQKLKETAQATSTFFNQVENSGNWLNIS